MGGTALEMTFVRWGRICGTQNYGGRWLLPVSGGYVRRRRDLDRRLPFGLSGSGAFCRRGSLRQVGVTPSTGQSRPASSSGAHSPFIVIQVTLNIAGQSITVPRRGPTLLSHLGSLPRHQLPALRSLLPHVQNLHVHDVGGAVPQVHLTVHISGIPMNPNRGVRKEFDLLNN